MKNYIVLLLSLFILSSCHIPENNAIISKDIDQYLSTTNSFIDFKNEDLSSCDDTDLLKLIDHSIFNTGTIWPDEFSVQGIHPSELLTDYTINLPGIKELQQQGLKGQGIKVAIIGPPILPEHQEYRNSIIKYTEVGIDKPIQYNPSATAVVSLLVGERTGIVPESEILYYAVPLVLDDPDSQYVVEAIEDLQRQLETSGNGDISFLYIPFGAAYHKEAVQEAVQSIQNMGIEVLNYLESIQIKQSKRALSSKQTSINAYNPVYTMVAGGYQLFSPLSGVVTADSASESSYAYHGLADSVLYSAYLAGIYAQVLQNKESYPIVKFMGALGRSVDSNKYGMNFIDIKEVISFCNLSQEEQLDIFINTVYKPPSVSSITDENIPVYENVGSIRPTMDFSSKDLSNIDLSEKSDEWLQTVVFNSETIWPESKMPQQFDPEKIIKLGMNPGLEIRTLHSQGITGNGIGIAVIDAWATLYDHEDLGGRVQYHEVVYDPESYATVLGPGMHGIAMMSTVAGEQCGVAPGSDIYYLAATPSVQSNNSYMTKTLIGLNLALEKLLQIQENLPSEELMRVISYSGLVDKGMPGYERFLELEAEALEHQMYIIYGEPSMRFQGARRILNADPDSIESYDYSYAGDYLYFDNTTFYWFRDDINYVNRNTYPSEYGENAIMVPMDGITVASKESISSYIYLAYGGMSNTIPWIAGLYALCCEVNNAMTPELFWKGVEKTASRNSNGLLMMNPKGLIEYISQTHT